MMKNFLKRFILLSILAIILILSSITVYAVTYNYDSNDFNYTTKNITLAAALDELYARCTGGAKSGSDIGPEDSGKTVRGYLTYLQADGVSWSDEWQIIREYNGNVFIITKWAVKNPTSNTRSLSCAVDGDVTGRYPNSREALFNNPEFFWGVSLFVDPSIWNNMQDSSIIKAVAYMLDSKVWNEKYLDTPNRNWKRFLCRWTVQPWIFSVELMSITTMEVGGHYLTPLIPQGSGSDQICSMWFFGTLSKSTGWWNNGESYWIAAPHCVENTVRLVARDLDYVNYAGYNYEGDLGFRPIVCLNSNVRFAPNLDGTEYILQ